MKYIINLLLEGFLTEAPRISQQGSSIKVQLIKPRNSAFQGIHRLLVEKSAVVISLLLSEYGAIVLLISPATQRITGMSRANTISARLCIVLIFFNPSINATAILEKNSSHFIYLNQQPGYHRLARYLSRFCHRQSSNRPTCSQCSPNLNRRTIVQREAFTEIRQP